MTSSAARDAWTWQQLIGQGSAESSQPMFMIACDFHTRLRQIAMMDCGTGKAIERRLRHEDGEVQAFYAALPASIGWEWKPPAIRTGKRGGPATQRQTASA